MKEAVGSNGSGICSLATETCFKSVLDSIEQHALHLWSSLRSMKRRMTPVLTNFSDAESKENEQVRRNESTSGIPQNLAYGKVVSYEV